MVEIATSVAKSVENITVANIDTATEIPTTYFRQERDGEDGDESSLSDDNNSL